MTDPVLATMQTYDVIAGAYAEHWPGSRDDTVHVYDRLRARVGPGALVVDLGCGPGNHGKSLRAKGLRVIGIDLSASMLRLASADGPVVRADIRRPPLASASADALWSYASFLHVPRNDTTATLSAWRRIAKPGAPLVLSTSVGDRDDWEPVRYDTGRMRFYVHRTVEEIARAVGRAGFDIVQTTERHDRRDWLLVEAVARA
jgi:SAM-dependent methyltransferase